MKFLKKTSTLFILSGLLIFFSKTAGFFPGIPMGGINVETNILTYILGVIFIKIGIVLLLKESNKYIIEYSKCSKCEQTYTYIELKDGICPKCDIETIDINKYYDN